MKNIIESLNLIYYEYDEHSNELILDKDTPKEKYYEEFMRITYALTSHHIEFLVDGDRSILLGAQHRLANRVKRYLKVRASYIRNSKMNIYILSDKKVKWAKNLPLFEIKIIEQDIELSNYDALIFTSKNALYSLDSLDSTWKSKPAYVIAPQTAKKLEALGGTLAFVGKEKHGNEFALEIVQKLKGKRVLYVRAARVVSNLLDILESHSVACDELVVYETLCKSYDKGTKLPKGSTFIFSSPSTIECFFKSFVWDDSFKAISIGDTTAKYFPEGIEPVVAETTSLESCVRKAIELNS